MDSGLNKRRPKLLSSRTKVWVALGLAAALFAARVWTSKAVDLPLRSGTRVSLLEIAERKRADGIRTMIVRYTTNIPLSDTASLRRQALEVWLQLAETAEERHVDQAVLTAQSAPRGVCYRGVGLCVFRARRFPFQRDSRRFMVLRRRSGFAGAVNAMQCGRRYPSCSSGSSTNTLSTAGASNTVDPGGGGFLNTVGGTAHPADSAITRMSLDLTKGVRLEAQHGKPLV